MKNNPLNNSSIVVVTPVYEDYKSAERLFCELSVIIGAKLFILAIDDGSQTEPLTKEVFIKSGVEGRILNLKRNVGHQEAISIGLNYLSQFIKEKHKIVILDSDGEDDPNAISKLLDSLDSKDIDVVVAERRKREESLFFRVFYFIYKIIFSILTGRQISFGNFMVLSPRALERIILFRTLKIHIAATVLSSKLRIKYIPIDRKNRYFGVSKMNFSDLVLHGFRALMVFSEDVLVRVGLASIATALISFLGLVSAVILKFTGMTSPGWFSIASGILALIFLHAGAMTLMILLLNGTSKISYESNHKEAINEVLDSK